MSAKQVVTVAVMKALHALVATLDLSQILCSSLGQCHASSASLDFTRARRSKLVRHVNLDTSLTLWPLPGQQAALRAALVGLGLIQQFHALNAQLGLSQTLYLLLEQRIAQRANVGSSA